MKVLPKGYYAISKDTNATSFVFKGVTYDVVAGENLFPSLKDANAFIKEIPDTVIAGLDYESFDAPVVLFSRSCIMRGIFRLAQTLKSGVYFEVNEHFEHKCNTKITILDGF